MALKTPKQLDVNSYLGYQFPKNNAKMFHRQQLVVRIFDIIALRWDKILGKTWECVALVRT